MRNFFRQRVIDPLLGLLKQGLSPRELALCLALGAGVGVFPVLGVSTPLLTFIAFARRLNLAAMVEEIQSEFNDSSDPATIIDMDATGGGIWP